MENKPEQYKKLMRATMFAVVAPACLAVFGLIGNLMVGPAPTSNINPIITFLVTVGGVGVRLVGLVALAVVVSAIRNSFYNLRYFFWWLGLLISAGFFLIGGHVMLFIKLGII